MSFPANRLSLLTLSLLTKYIGKTFMFSSLNALQPRSVTYNGRLIEQVNLTIKILASEASGEDKYRTD